MSRILDQAKWITDSTKKELLEQMAEKNNPGGYIQICIPLGGSRKNPSTSTVYKICYLDAEERPINDLIVKIGTLESLEKEYNNFLEFVSKGALSSNYKVEMYSPFSYDNIAALEIEVVDLQNHKVFSDYYKDKPEKVIETLLNKALKDWHDRNKPRLHDPKEYFISRLRYHKNNLFEECNLLYPGFDKKCECYVQDLKRSFPNPIFQLKNETFNFKENTEFWTVESIIHGDLNFNNILVEDESHIKLIDYEYTRKDITFDDFARLECEIKYTALKNYDNESFWRGLIKFEEYLTTNLLVNEDELPDIVKQSEDLKKAAKCIAIIRQRSNEIIKQESRVNDTAYWIELLIRTLKYISYKSEDGKSQITESAKKYALISSLLLADKCFKECEIKSTSLSPFTIYSGPQMKNDSLLIKENKYESEYLTQLQRTLLAGNTLLFLGPNAPRDSNSQSISDIATELYRKYANEEPTSKKPNMLFSYLFKTKKFKDLIHDDIYDAFKKVSLDGFYKTIPTVYWKRIFVQSIDFLVERSYEETCPDDKVQDYQNRFSPFETRNDEDTSTIIIERPYGSARFFNEPGKSMQLSAESINKGKILRQKWYDLITDIRPPISVLFHGFEWENLQDLYFDIKSRVEIADDNSNFFWIETGFSEQSYSEASLTDLKLITHPLEEILNDVKSIKIEDLKKEKTNGINISFNNKHIYINPEKTNVYSKYFEIIHDDIEKTEELEIGPFFQGEEINWLELESNCDVYRTEIKNYQLEEKIKREIDRTGENKGILLLAEYAGAGVTTIMKRTGFNLAKSGVCPVVYLNRLDSSTWKMLEDFYQDCGKNKFLILIDNVPFQSDRFRELFSMLQSRRINSFILATARKDEWNQEMISYIRSSGDIQIDEDSEIKHFKWIKHKLITDLLDENEKRSLLKNYLDFGILTKNAISKFGKGNTQEEMKYSNLLPLCWAATEGKNRKFEFVVNEYYQDKLKLSERRIIDIVCLVNFFFSKGVTDRILHRAFKINWNQFELLLKSDSMQQLIVIKSDFYNGKEICRILPRNYGISEIILHPESSTFSNKILDILTELPIQEGEEVEEDLLFNIVRNKKLHQYLPEKSNKDIVFKFASEQSPNDIRILQHWGIMLYEHAQELAKHGLFDDTIWEDSLDKFNQALDLEPTNPAILHSFGMAYLIRGNILWEKYRHDRSDKTSFRLAYAYQDDAIKYFRKAIDVNPRDEHAYNTIAGILLERIRDFKNKDETETFEKLMAELHELLEECNRLVPTDKQLVLPSKRSQWYNLRGQSSKAKKQYREILTNNPKNHSVSYLLATLLMEDNTTDSLKEAEKILIQALQEGKKSKGFYILRYQIAERLYLFDYPKLELILKGLVDSNPNDPYLIFKYAVISFKNENYPGSRQYFNISEKLRLADPLRFKIHDCFWKKTDNLDVIKQIWEGKQSFSMLEVFEGNVDKISDFKGYVIMDKSGERLYFDPQRLPKDKILHEGQRVKFNITFNYIEPIASDPASIEFN